MSLGFGEIIVILLIAFVVVGPQDLPKVARTIAKALRQMKALYGDIKDSLRLEDELAEIKRAAADAGPVPAGLPRELAEIRREIDRVKSVKL